MTTLQAVLFEIQLLKSKDSELEGLDALDLQNSIKAGTAVASKYEEFESQGGPEFSREDPNTLPKEKRGAQGLRSILLKGEMRYLKDVNMLVFLCSPL